MAERFPEPVVQKSIEGDLALINPDDRLLTGLELDLVQTAKAHEAQTFYRLRSIPGVGKILALVLLYEIHAIHHFPRVQAFVSYGRRVTCAKESAGKRDGTSGTKIGNAYLTWAFSEAAVLFLRHKPAGQTYLARLERRHGKGKALTVLAQQLAHAVYDMVKRDSAFDLDKFFHESGMEWASLPPHWTPMGSACIPRSDLAQTLRLGTHMSRPYSLIPARDWTSAPAPKTAAMVALMNVCCSSPAPGTNWRTVAVQPRL